MSGEQPRAARWTFLTNHSHVLLCLARSPDLRLRDVAAEVGLTERAVQRIVADLEEAGYLIRRRSGRHNEYQIDGARPLRHALEAHQSVQSLIRLVKGRALAQGGDSQALAQRAVARRAPRRRVPSRSD